MSNEKRGIKVIALFFFLIVYSSLSGVGAFSLDAAGATSAELCPRDTGLFVSSLRNDNPEVMQFTLSRKGSASGWSTTVPTGVVLGPGEQEAVYTYVTPTQGVLPGNYDLEVVAAGAGEVKTSSFGVRVKDCFGAALGTAEPVRNACPGQVVKFEARLRNAGVYREDFIVRVEGPLKEGVSLSDDVVSLASGEAKTVFAYVVAPVVANEYGVSVIASGSSGRSVESLNFVLKVQPCYDFRVEVEEKTAQEFCEATSKVVPLKVVNVGTTTNTFDLRLGGPSWVVLDKNTLTLLAGQSTNLNIVMAPAFGVEGDFKVKVEVIPQRGDQKAVAEVAVRVRKCHDVALQVLEKEVTVCNNGRERSYPVVLKNTGTMEKKYLVTVTGPSWVSADLPGMVELGPGRERNASLRVNPGQSVQPGAYDIVLKVNASDESAVTVSDSAVFVVNAVDTKECYKPLLESQYEDLVVYLDSNVVVPVTVQNRGLEPAEYELVVGGSAATFVSLAPAVVSVDPGRTETVYMYVAPGAGARPGLFDVQVAARLKDSTVLGAKSWRVRLTDVKEDATVIGGAQASEGSFWSRLKALLKRWFVAPEIVEEVKLQAENESEPVVGNGAKEGSSSNFFERYRYWILGAIIFVLLIVIIVRTDAHKKVGDFFSEDDDDE